MTGVNAMDDRTNQGERVGAPEAADAETPLAEAEIERYARAIVRIVEKELAPESDQLRRSGNTYATAFQFLVLRRGGEYGQRLGRAAEARALELLALDGHDVVGVTIADIHEKVCRETEPM